MSAALDEHGTRLRDIDGIGPVTVGRTRRASRFPTAAAFCELQLFRTGADRQRRHRPPPPVPLR